MPEQKPIPVRLSGDVISRLDAVAESIGGNRAGLIRLCTTTFLDYLDKVGVAGMPIDWQKIIEETDGRRAPIADKPSEVPSPERKIIVEPKRSPKKKT